MTVKIFSATNSWHLKLIFNVFKLLGLASMSIEDDEVRRKNAAKIPPVFKYSLIGALYNVTLTVFVVGINIVAIPKIYIMEYEGRTTVNRVTDTARAALGLIATILVLFMYCTQQKAAVQLGNNIHGIEGTLGQLCDSYNRRTMTKYI